MLELAESFQNLVITKFNWCRLARELKGSVEEGEKQSGCLSNYQSIIPDMFRWKDILMV